MLIKEAKMPKSEEQKLQIELLWDKQGRRGTKEDFYNNRMDAIIKQLKDKVKDLE